VTGWYEYNFNYGDKEGLVSRWGKEIYGSLVWLFLVLFFIGTVSASAAASPEKGDWLVEHLIAEPTTLNPLTATDVYEGTINRSIYQSLLERDNRTLQLVPNLAESWESSPDGLSYLFTLREGIFWHDGVPLTTEDVVFTYMTLMDPEVDAPHLRTYVRDLIEVKALDDRRVRFTFSRPYFLSLEIAGSLVGIIPKHIFSQGDINSHNAGRSPVGTGPYRFVRWETGKEIVLEKNDDYWGEKPLLDRIVFRIITDETVALQVLKKGEIDLMTLTPLQWYRQTEDRKFKRKFKKLTHYLPGYSFIGWNQRRPFFTDSRVRKAMTMLVERDSILQNVLYNRGRVVSGNFFCDSPDYDRTIEPWPYDPIKAAILLDEAGWVDSDGDGIRDRDGVPFQFELTLTAGSRFGEKVATIFQEALKGVGIQMDIRSLDWSLFNQLLDDRSFDAVLMGWSLPVEADPYQVWHSSQTEKGSNFIGFVNREADLIIEEARATFEKGKRIALYKRFHRIMHEEQPYTFLFVNESLIAVDKRFQDVKIYPLGLNPAEWWVEEKRQVYR
jgi:peptide/nickel transport system substrate-binding protein